MTARDARRPSGRERGATFVLVVLLLATLLISLGSLFIESSRQSLEMANFRARRARAFHLADSGVVLVRRAIETPAAGTPVDQRVVIDGCPIDLHCTRRDDGRFEIESTATVTVPGADPDTVTVRATVRLTERDGRRHTTVESFRRAP